MNSSAMPWIKLHTSRLDDSIFARLTDTQKWRYIQLELLAGKLDAGGCFMENGQELTELDIAWKLRIDEIKLQFDLGVLSSAGLVSKNGHGWFLPNFENEQGPTQADKRAAWKDRQKKHREEGHAVVTGDTLVTGANVTPTDIDIDIESESESDLRVREDKDSSSSSTPKTKTDDDDQSIRKIFRAAGVRKQELKYLASTEGIQPNDCWAMLAWAWCQEKIEQPGKIMAMNILAGERASADWYDESKWRAIPLAIRKAGGLIIQSKEEQEDQLPIVAIRNSRNDETVTPQIEQWWQSVQGQLKMEMAKASFDTWVWPTKPIHYEAGILTIVAQNEMARDWLEQRLNSTATRLLQGIANQNLTIQFVVGEEVQA
jgi:hypothetical protein